MGFHHTLALVFSFTNALLLQGLGKYDIVSLRYQIIRRKFKYDEKIRFTIVSKYDKTAHVEQEKTNKWEKEKLPWNKLLCLRKNQCKQNWKKISSETSMEFAQTKKSRDTCIVIVFDLQEKKMNEAQRSLNVSTWSCSKVRFFENILAEEFFALVLSNWLKSIEPWLTAIWFKK